MLFRSLTSMIQTLLGLLNILGGSAFFARRFFIKPDGIDVSQDASEAPPILKRLNITHFALNSVSIAFGVSMLLPGLISGLIVALILVLNGGIIFTLAYLAQEISKMQESPKPQIV